MIEKMKKVTLVALQQDQAMTLKTLRDLEILHIQHSHEESADLTDSLRKTDSLQSALRSLSEYKPSGEVDGGKFASMSAAELAHEAETLVAHLETRMEELVHFHREIEDLKVWGNFRPEELDEMRAKGIYIHLVIVSEEQMEELPEHVFKVELHRDKGNIYAAVISTESFEIEHHEAHLPPHSLATAEMKLRKHEEAIGKLKEKLTKIASQSEKLERALVERGEACDYLRARDSMGQQGELEYITGYVPANRKGEIVQMAYRRGWAMLLDDPAADDPKVPTLLRVPNWLKVSKPVFDFIGIRPGYREYDVSACFLIFFTIFFGMIIGDGGYGMVFLAAAVGAKLKLRKPESQPPINLFILLSAATVLWGYLTGNWFGIPNGADGAETPLPAFMRGLDWFTDPKTGNQHVQLLCFIIAVLHLSIAHGWQALASLAVKKPLQALGQIGWISFVVGAFLVIIEMVVGIEVTAQLKTVSHGLLGVGFVLMLFSINWKDIGDILNFPFGALGGFVDSLSYIRLFAVGLSGYYVAVSMNEMAGGLMDGGGFGLVAGLLVLLFGHLLNIALCVMGVLVHGIRLNTLEFSGHLGLEWTGLAFNPFSKRKK